MKTTAILMLLLAAGCATARPDAVVRQGTNALVLSAEGMTFRLVDPTVYGTNTPPFFLLETEVTNEMYAQYLRDTKQRKNDSLTVRQARDLHSSGKWSTASPAWRVENMSLIWDETTPPKEKEKYPVALVTHSDATNFCSWLTGRHRDLGVFRLPTKTEWMIAAYGSNRDYPWGDRWSISIPHVSESEEREESQPVPVTEPTGDVTPEGIRHLWGNVHEYIQNPWGSWDVFWMGASFSSYPMKENWPFTPRQDYWGYVHNGDTRMETLGFRVLLVPKTDHTTTKSTLSSEAAPSAAPSER